MINTCLMQNYIKAKHMKIEKGSSGNFLQAGIQTIKDSADPSTESNALASLNGLPSK